MARTQIFKHMMPGDIPLFSTFVLSPEGQDYHAWEFDVLVGDPEDPGPFYPPSTRRQAMYLNALKIDAVGWFFASPRLIECKPHAGLGALGQVLGYRKWYQLIFGTLPSTMIVCEVMSRQVETLCNLEGVEVRRVEPADDYAVIRAVDYVQPLIQAKSLLPQLGSLA